jgi:SPP1 family predicted phage head-tail adaptor
MSLNSGKLRHRIVILESDQEQDSDTGDIELTWTTIATVWCAWEPYSTKEFLAAASIQNQTSVRAVIRYRSDVTAGMRVQFRSKTYEIVGPPLPDKDSGLEYLTLMLAEVVNA